MHRFGELDELVGAAIYLASPSASYVTGETICVDGGFLAAGLD
jgi:NAD(P)-dependent dehydrogenase (short-subunit alcohol dehydrogenase family)